MGAAYCHVKWPKRQTWLSARPPQEALSLDHIDQKVIELLVEDGRISFADIGRLVGITRSSARERVQHLVKSGLIEKFTTIVNPSLLGKTLSVFYDLQVTPYAIEAIADHLSKLKEVSSLYIMSDMRSLHMHVLVKDIDELAAFSRAHLFGRSDIVAMECKTLMSRLKQRRGGPRI